MSHFGREFENEMSKSGTFEALNIIGRRKNDGFALRRIPESEIEKSKRLDVERAYDRLLIFGREPDGSGILLSLTKCFGIAD